MSQKQEIPNEHINYKVLANHFNLTNESMRIAYKKYLNGDKESWLLRVKAYNFDKNVPNNKSKE